MSKGPSEAAKANYALLEACRVVHDAGLVIVNGDAFDRCDATIARLREGLEGSEVQVSYQKAAARAFKDEHDSLAADLEALRGRVTKDAMDTLIYAQHAAWCQGDGPYEYGESERMYLVLGMAALRDAILAPTEADRKGNNDE